MLLMLWSCFLLAGWQLGGAVHDDVDVDGRGGEGGAPGAHTGHHQEPAAAAAVLPGKGPLPFTSV